MKKNIKLSNNPWVINGVFLMGVLVFLVVFKIWIKPTIIHASWYMWFYEKICYPSILSIKGILKNPVTYIAITIILTLERFLPAKRGQKIFSASFAQDVVWFFLDLCFQVTILAALTSYWTVVYKEHFNFLTVHSIEKLPFWIRFAIGVLVADFAGWLHHYVRHKVVWLWQFHTIHHSQKQLNLFTDVRYHIVEYIITNVTNTFFVLMFTANPHAVIYYTLFHSWYTKMCHANIKSNFGLLKYILITPQSHRVHHSVELRHRDKNLGILLSIWDYLFGTQYRKYDEYPDTGIDDEKFPHETEATGLSLMIMPIKQHLYPFEAILRNFRKRKE